jgi:hypothetical protein
MGSVFNAVYRSDVRASFAGSPLPEAAQAAVRQSLGVALEVADKVSAVAGADAAARVRGPAIDAFIAGFHASSLVAAALAMLAAAAVAAFLRRPHAPRIAVVEPAGPASVESTLSAQPSGLAGVSR